MKGRNILKQATVLLLIALMIVSSGAIVANTGTHAPPTNDVQTKEILLGYTTDPQSANAETWLFYDDGASETAVGSNTPPLFMAIRLTNAELAPYNGMQFVATSWYHIVYNTSIPDHDYDAKIWIGNETRPITLLVNDTGLLASGEGWMNHTLSAPVTIDASNDYWIVIKCYANPAQAFNDYPMPFDTNLASNISHKSKWWHNSLNHPETDFYEVATLNGAWLLRVAVEGEIQDTTPPVTTCVITGTNPVTITLSATDDMSGVNHTFYKIDSGSFAIYTAPVVVSDVGDHVVYFYSVDFAGNIEAEKNQSFNVEAPPIAITIKGGFGVSATIKNTGATNLTNISWTINLNGSMIFFGKAKEGTIGALAAGHSVTVKDFVIGLGKTGIAVTAGDAEAAATGKVLLFFVLGVA
jgi:hypothetical protein